MDDKLFTKVFLQKEGIMTDIETVISDEVNKRKTFAIISHPDAGKTTITEKLLLYGGAIRLAGAVKSRKANKFAISDWMEIEKQRGISVTSSVLQFRYKDYCINILDTPGHQDFSEDTYRTLIAADSAVMLIDGAKGVEEQTIKLFHVCKMRKIPVFTFINKMDRASKDPFELMQEIEDVLGIKSYPMNWPIGTDGDFKGIYNRSFSHIELFEGGNHGQSIVASKIAEKMGLSEEEINNTYWAGMAHDIGKLLVSIDILNKKTSLTDKEYELIKKHPIWGYKALSKSDSLKHIAKYVLYHHERWDGRGYPEGIKGDNIPLISRILAVADAWDAMTSKRAYRAPFSREEALKEIETVFT